jgi:uncharacterized protein (TIGR02996 family)
LAGVQRQREWKRRYIPDEPRRCLAGSRRRAADPIDDATREIYADWLEERGDPRGEYLRLETQRTRLPERLATLALKIDPRWIDAIRGHHRISIVGWGPNKIAAIKALRELTGLGLREAVQLGDLASETTPSLPECLGAASGCVLLPGLPHLGLDHRAAWVEAESDGTVTSMVSRVGIDPISDPDTAILAMLLAA